MMGNRPKNPANARNKNVLVVDGSGSGKTRFWLKPNLLQCHSSYVVTDPKGDKHGKVIYEPYRIKVLNTINFKKSMHYNPFAYKQLYDSSAAFQRLKPVYDGLQKIKFEKPRSKYKAEHEAELIQFYAARRKLTGEFPDGKVDMKKLSDEYDELEQAHETTYGEFKAVRDDLHRLWKVRSCVVDTAARFNERTEEQKLQNRPQTRHKKEDMTR